MANGTNIPPADSASDGSGRLRSRLAGWIIGLSLVGIAAISVGAIYFAETLSSRAEMTRLVFGSVLPLFGTWVGTVLAFYFARENFAAATDSTLRLTGRLTVASPVRESMIRRSDMLVRQLGAGETDASVSLQQLATSMQARGFKRIPILSQSGAARYVIHDSLIMFYAANQGVAANDPAFLAKTLADLRSVAEFKDLSEAIAFVAETATLGDARDRMQAVKGSNDVFVTASGSASEPVVGWLTNSLLATVQ